MGPGRLSPRIWGVCWGTGNVQEQALLRGLDLVGCRNTSTTFECSATTEAKHCMPNPYGGSAWKLFAPGGTSVGLIKDADEKYVDAWCRAPSVDHMLVWEAE